MIPLDTFQQLFDYNYWARDRQLQACRALTEEQFLRPLGNSFPSVRDTLAHMVGSEWVWLERWQGRSPKSSDADLLEFSAENFPSLEAIRERWVVVERDVRDYLVGLSEESLSHLLSYVNVAGETWTYPLWETLLHVVNHGTYHRGQVTTLLRQLGAQPASIDFLLARDKGALGFRK